MQSIIIQTLIPVAATLFTGLASWALATLNRYTAEKLKNEKINAAMERITHTTQTTVDQLTQTVASAMKEATQDGKLTSDQSNSLKYIATNTIIKQLPDATKNAAEMAVGSLNKLISSKIEQAVLKQKSKTISATETEI